jgi:putative transposase
MFSISRLQQLLQDMPWGTFDRAVEKHRGDRHCKGFDSRKHLVAMLYAQLSDVSSLRQLEASFNQHTRHQYHLGVDPLRRSTISDANRLRNPQIFAETVQALMQRAGRCVRSDRKYMLYLLDSTTISLQGRGFDWTAATATRHRGLKLHLMYARDGNCPVFHSVTPANINDVTEGQKFPIHAGATYVFDKGYCNYNWWHRFTAAGARVVTRPKKNAALVLHEVRPVSKADAGVILADQVEGFKHSSNRGGHKNQHAASHVRRIAVHRPGEEPLVLITNDLESPATEIAQLYKERWQIELFFKWIKQHLQVKRFLGRTENAVRIQLLIALIAYLLVLIYKQKHALKATLWHVLAEIRGGLMHRVEPVLSGWKDRRRRLAHLAALQPRLL